MVFVGNGEYEITVSNLEPMKSFLLTADHIKLLRRLLVDNGGGSGNDWFAPEIDSKRPFGNSDIRDDAARILGFKPIMTDDGEEVWPIGTTESIVPTFNELGTALQVVLATGAFEPGCYKADDYDNNWRKA